MARIKKVKVKDNKKITTLEMELMLMRHFKFNQKIIVPNVRNGIKYKKKSLNDCDLLILSKSNYATQIEIKVTKADLKHDFQKKHNQNYDHMLIKTFYYAVPHYLKEFALTIIPEEAGLLSVSNKGVTEIKKAKTLEHVKWDDELKLKLCTLGTMRIYNLKMNNHKGSKK